MTDITVGIYGSEAEIVSYTPGNTELLLRFCEPLEGFLSLADKSFAVTGGKCLIKIGILKDGEITPRLVTQSRILCLPKIIKDGNTVFPVDCDDTFIRSLSRRERALEKKLLALEEKVELLCKSVYGTSLFN